MNIEQLQEMWQTDSQIDTDEYGNASIIIPQLHQRYMEFHNTFSLMKKNREADMKVLVKDKWIYYKGKAPSLVYKDTPFDLKLTDRKEVDMFIAADEDVVKLQLKIDYIEQVLVFLDSILRQLNNRNYQIKNAIDWEKFKAGM
tara:strand:+ start:1219 stop:1647 length:429 start_codon:yes stop_codon:yes gene_type:complete